MSTDRLAALLHGLSLGCREPYANPILDEATHAHDAARLIAKGVRVGDDGLDMERLRERLHAEVERLTNGATRPESRQMQERLLRAVDVAVDAAVAQGVRVGDPPPPADGLRAAAQRVARNWFDYALPAEAMNDAMQSLRAALAAQPAPTLDRERLARAMETQQKQFLDQPESFDSTEAVAAAVAEAYEAEP